MARDTLRGSLVLAAWGWFGLALVAVSFASASERGMVVVRDSTGNQVGLYTESHALLVGVSDYTAGWPDLESIPRELRRVEHALRAQGFQVVKELDLNAEQLRRAFENFINRYGFDTNNRLLFYFSGHGYTRREGTKGYLVPADAPNPRWNEKAFLRKALDMDQIIAWTRRIEAKHALFLFDSCFSGSVFMARNLPARPPHITTLTNAPVRQFITAGSAGETVPAKSTFAQVFVDGIEHRLADLDGDGFVTGTELGSHIQATVPRHVRQTPQFGKHPDYELSRGDFVFVLERLQPPPVPTATLTVRSNVDGASLHIDGEARGPTGPTVHDLAPGTHTVRVEKPGYKPWELTLVLAPGQRRRVRADLIRWATPGRPSQTSRLQTYTEDSVTGFVSGEDQAGVADTVITDPFKFDSAELSLGARAALDEWVLAYKRSPDRRRIRAIRITGHTDRIGNLAWNRALSVRRAEAVRDYLVGRGVSQTDILVEGRGPAEPLVDCEGKGGLALIDCLAPNRRIEIELVY